MAALPIASAGAAERPEAPWPNGCCVHLLCQSLCRMPPRTEFECKRHALHARRVTIKIIDDDFVDGPPVLCPGNMVAVQRLAGRVAAGFCERDFRSRAAEQRGGPGAPVPKSA